MKAAAPVKKKRFNAVNFRELGLLIFILLLIAIVQSLNSTFLTPKNISNLLTNTAIIAILSIGMMIVILTEGIDLSLGANIALSGMVVAMHVAANPGLHPLVALLEGTALGMVQGLLVGLLIAKVNVLPIIASLGMCYVYRGAVFLISGGSWVSAHQMSTEFKAIATGKIGFNPTPELGEATKIGINNLVFIAIIVFIIAFYFLNYTRTGRRFYAVGSNMEAARVSGIQADNTKLLAYIIMGALSGLVGVLWVSKYASAQPDTAMGYEINIIAACVIGGVSISGGSGRVLGVFMGAMLIGIINNALPLISNVSEFAKNLIQGCIILGAVLINTGVKRRADWNVLVRRKI
ncbi:ABC transporter permease [Christensenellaceae bacterium OttesenSCG-928-M15]|nr:ABC transporter permease [Christensenellaceae bacterium OttesenSCG-928-M15]